MPAHHPSPLPAEPRRLAAAASATLPAPLLVLLLALLLTLLLTLLLAAAVSPASAAPAAPRLACHVTYGGETRTLHASPVASPYEVAPVAIGSYFLFRIVWQTAPAALAAVKLYTYADRDDGPALIHQQSVAWPAPAARRSVPGGFTGLQWVYEPMRDGELHYWCEPAGGH